MKTANEFERGVGFKDIKGWQKYVSFRDWSLVNGYAEDLTIDRIDVDGDYTPKNCRWATWAIQRANKRKYGK